MKALSIRQPWAWLIVHGYKDIENRSRNFGYRGRLLVHTGKQLAPNFEKIVEKLRAEGIPIPYYLPTGGVVGEVIIKDTVTKSESLWFTGPYGLVLENPKPLKFFRCLGQTGIFNI